MFGSFDSVMIALLAVNLILITNFIVVRRLGSYALPERMPKISVLVPARNEECNIGACIRSLADQRYPNYEILALDDASTDRTRAILLELAARYPRVRLVEARPLPDGWLGKHWACQQLADQAAGELLLFVDADTVCHPDTLAGLAAAQAALRGDLLAVIPGEQVISPAEKLVVPFFLWGVLSFIPVGIGYHLPWRFLSFAVGQAMLFRREAYARVGGHAAVRDDVVDDLALARRIKAARLRWRLVDGSAHVQCRMYHNWDEVQAGFSKDAFAAFGYNVTVFLAAWAGMYLTFVLPLIFLLLAVLRDTSAPTTAGIAASGVLLALAQWLLFYARLGFPIYLGLFYPVTITLYTLLALRSLILTLTGRAHWKDRPMVRKRVRWI